MVLGGDWKQLLPMVKGPVDYALYTQIEACLQSFPLYESFEHILLTENMRAKDDPAFVDFIERVAFCVVANVSIGWLHFKLGSSREVDANGYQAIPEKYFVDSLEELLSFVYDDGIAVADPEKAVKRLILAPTNEEVNEVNEILQSHLTSPEKEYLACDTPIGSKTHDPYYMGGIFFLYKRFGSTYLDHQTEILNR